MNYSFLSLKFENISGEMIEMIILVGRFLDVSGESLVGKTRVSDVSRPLFSPGEGCSHHTF